MCIFGIPLIGLNMDATLIIFSENNTLLAILQYIITVHVAINSI